LRLHNAAAKTTPQPAKMPGPTRFKPKSQADPASSSVINVGISTQNGAKACWLLLILRKKQKSIVAREPLKKGAPTSTTNKKSKRAMGFATPSSAPATA